MPLHNGFRSVPFLLFLCAFYQLFIWTVDCLDARQASYMTVTDLIQYNDYPAEEHFVKTEDGYILLLNRIPYSRRKSKNKVFPQNGKRPVVLMAHGALASAAQYVFGNQSNSLGYICADYAFDVWLTNFRGNTFSKNHVYLKKTHPKFWEFSWDEIAQYDIPAIIDYILKVTGVNKINYVGHSMGSTTFFAAMSLRPEYNSKINHFFGWAPAVYLEHYNFPGIDILGQFYESVLDLYRSFNHNTFELLSKWNPATKGWRSFCLQMTWLCLMIIENTFGGDAGMFIPDMKEVMLYNYPSGSSLRIFAHFMQLRKTGEFRRYDYGTTCNVLHYGHLQPPEYNISSVTAPVTLFEAKDDPFVRSPDLDKLEKSLVNVRERYVIKRESFGHLSYLIETDLYDRVLLPTMIRLMKYNSPKAA